jgi:sugar phosphate isomerase/epimerase
MIASLSLRGLGLAVDDPLVVAHTAVRVGFDGWHLHLHKLNDNGWARLTELWQAHAPATVTWVYPVERHADAGPNSSRLLDAFARCASAAAEAGCRTVSTWLPPSAGAFEGVVRWLAPVAHAAESAGLRLVVEAEPWPDDPSMAVEATLHMLAAARDVAGTDLGVALDSTFCNGATVTCAQRYGLPVADVHVAAGGPMRALHGLERDSTCQSLLRALRRAGYHGPVMVESFSETGRPAVAAARDAHQQLGALLASLDEPLHVSDPRGLHEGR